MRLLLVLVSLAFLAFPKQAVAQPVPPEQASECLQTYLTAEMFHGSFGGEENYELRKFRAGAALPAKQRRNIDSAAFERSFALAEELGTNLGEDTDNIRALGAAVSQCDQLFAIPPSATAEPVVDHMECAVTYGALAFSHTSEAPRALFGRKTRLATAAYGFWVGAEQSDNMQFVPQVREDAQAKAREVFPGGQLEASRLMILYNAAQGCDRQYGLEVTPVPPELAARASGRE